MLSRPAIVGRDLQVETIHAALESGRTRFPNRCRRHRIADGGLPPTMTIALAEGESLQIRAASPTRPVVRLLDYMADRPDAFTISGAKGSLTSLDGLLITGRGPVRSDGDPDAPRNLARRFVRRDHPHCTLVPGWGLHCDCEPGASQAKRRAGQHRARRSRAQHRPNRGGSRRARHRPVASTLATVSGTPLAGACGAGGPDDGMAYVRLSIARAR